MQLRLSSGFSQDAFAHHAGVPQKLHRPAGKGREEPFMKRLVKFRWKLQIYTSGRLSVIPAQPMDW